MKMLRPLALLLLIGWPAPAQAQEPAPAVGPGTQSALRLTLRIRSVAQPAHLRQLMRRNSVRVALQRHRLWQQAMVREQHREQTQNRNQTQNRTQTRLRHRRRARSGAMGAATPAAPKAMQPRKVDSMAGPKAAMKVAVQRASTPVKARPMAPANLRDLLRRGRAGDAKRLEQKLRDRIREQRRQREQLRNRGHRGSSMSSGKGGRGGR